MTLLGWCRIVQYSTELEVKDYFRWRQVDSEFSVDFDPRSSFETNEGAER